MWIFIVVRVEYFKACNPSRPIIKQASGNKLTIVADHLLYLFLHYGLWNGLSDFRSVFVCTKYNTLLVSDKTRYVISIKVSKNYRLLTTPCDVVNGVTELNSVIVASSSPSMILHSLITDLRETF